MGTVGILNVGAGDIELRFDGSNISERLRAARIVKDMLRRGYALLVEVERDGEKRFERALDFDEGKACYIIADFDPVTAHEADGAEQMAGVRLKEKAYGESEPPQETAPGTGDQPPAKQRGRPRREVPASSTRAVSVGRSAGG